MTVWRSMSRGHTLEQTNKHPEERSAADTRLHGRGLLLVRMAWVAIVFLSLAVSIADIPLEFAQLHIVCVVAIVIFWRKSNDWMALLVALFLVLFPASQGLGSHGSPTAVGVAYPSLQLLTSFLDAFGWTTFLLFLYLFPDGRFVPRWTSLFPNLYKVLPGLDFAPTVIGIIVGIFLVLVIVKPLVFPSNGNFNLPNEFIANILFSGTVLLIPLSICFSVLRYRLYDIDLLINRTLVYAILTALLALIYFSLVLGLQFLFRGLTKESNDIVIVASTLAIAALFQPLRRRIQKIIDRRFYRQKYDAVRTLAAFSTTLQNEVVINQLRKHLISVVQETMQPAHVSLWIRGTDQENKPKI